MQDWTPTLEVTNSRSVKNERDRERAKNLTGGTNIVATLRLVWQSGHQMARWRIIIIIEIAYAANSNPASVTGYMRALGELWCLRLVNGWWVEALKSLNSRSLSHVRFSKWPMFMQEYIHGNPLRPFWLKGFLICNKILNFSQQLDNGTLTLGWPSCACNTTESPSEILNLHSGQCSLEAPFGNTHIGLGDPINGGLLRSVEALIIHPALLFLTFSF